MRKVLHHVGRHPEDAADFLHAELSRGEELAVLGRQGDGLVGHALLQHSHLVGIVRAAVHSRPVVTDLAGVFQDTGMFQNTAGLCAVLEEGRAVLLHCQRGAEGVLHHGNGRKAHQTIEAQTRHMEYLIRPEVDVLVLLPRHFVRVGVVDIEDVAGLVSVHFHVLRKQRIQPQHRVLAVTDDLGVGVAPQKKVGHHGLAKGKAGHLRVGLPVEDLVQRMVRRFFLPVPAFRVPVEMQRKPRHRLGQQPDTGIHSRDLHRRFLIHPLAGRSRAKEKGLPGIADIVRYLRQTGSICFGAVFGSIPGLAKAHPFQKSHFIAFSPFIHTISAFHSILCVI